MRVISGSAKGTVLFSPKNGLQTRPTADSVKESLFNILENNFFCLDSVRVLDLFAGTGAVGAEALSRGASECVFVELSGAVADIIKRNVQKIKLSNKCGVIIADAYTCTGKLCPPFDFVFIDPPYNQPAEMLLRLFSSLHKDRIIAKDGVVCLEQQAKENIPDFEGTGYFKIKKTYVYSNAKLTFFQTERE